MVSGQMWTATTVGAGYSSTQGSLQCAARLKAHSGVGAGHAVWGRPLEGGSKTDEGDLARAALLAMQVSALSASCSALSFLRLPHCAMRKTRGHRNTSLMPGKAGLNQSIIPARCVD